MSKHRKPLSHQFPTALVTGGSSGLGRVFVNGLLSEGVEVWATSRDLRRIDSQPGLHPLALDLCDRSAVNDLLSNPPWDTSPSLLINNAGYGVFGHLKNIGESEMHDQIEAMLSAPSRLTRHVLSAASERQPVAVVQVSSLAVEFPLPYFHGYNLVKHGLSGLAQSLFLEFPGGKGRSFVIDFRPGDFRTEFNQSALRKPDSRLDGVWARMEHHLQKGADPGIAWKDLHRSLQRGVSGTVRTGTFFQARLAPFFARWFPEKWVRWVHRSYYGI